MDLSSPVFGYCTQASWSCPSSDSEFYNISSPETTSPPSCVDFSPDVLSFPVLLTPQSSPLGRARVTFSPPSCGDLGSSGGRVRRTRSRNPSKQRQNASEKEKLRMRDLTKALHHLRTYLPPSVAPTGQALTKIETLRLTIRYISFLSSQLAVPEESLCHRTELRAPGRFCYSTTPESGRGSAFPEKPSPALGAQCQYSRMVEALPMDTDLELPACEQLHTSCPRGALERPLYPDTAFSYQNYVDVHSENTDVWS